MSVAGHVNTNTAPALQWRPRLNVEALDLNLWFPTTHIMEHATQVLGATMLLMKLHGETLSGNTDTALDGTTAGWWFICGILAFGHALCAATNYVACRQWRAWPNSVNPIMRCIRMRGICEAAYSCLQHVGLTLVVVRLPAYVSDAVRRAEAGGAGFGSMSGLSEDGMPEPLGIHINEDAPVSINAIMGPLWCAWIAQECVSIFFDARRAAVPNIDNEQLRHQLIAILKSIRIRPRGTTFMFNVQLSFCARMLDNAYRVSWMTLFILAWLSFAFMLCSLACLGIAFVAGFFVDAMSEATYIYKRLLCGSFRAVVMAVCVVAPVCCNFAFSLALARRLDGDETVAPAAILLPFIIGHAAAALLLLLSIAPTREGNPEAAAALAGSALGLPMGPFNDLLDSSALLPGMGRRTAGEQDEQPVARGIGLLAVAAAAADGTRGGGTEALDRERLEQWEAEKRAYRTTATTELLSRAGGAALYRTAVAAGGVGGSGGADDAELGMVEEATPGEKAGFGICQICFEDDSVANAVLLPCGHGGVCRSCAEAVASPPPHLCHMCRGRVLQISTLEPRGVCTETGLLRYTVVHEAPPPVQVSLLEVPVASPVAAHNMTGRDQSDGLGGAYNIHDPAHEDARVGP